MIEIIGNFNTARVFATTLEDGALSTAVPELRKVLSHDLRTASDLL